MCRSTFARFSFVEYVSEELTKGRFAHELTFGGTLLIRNARFHPKQTRAD